MRSQLVSKVTHTHTHTHIHTHTHTMGSVGRATLLIMAGRLTLIAPLPALAATE